MYIVFYVTLAWKSVNIVKLSNSYLLVFDNRYIDFKFIMNYDIGVDII